MWKRTMSCFCHILCEKLTSAGKLGRQCFSETLVFCHETLIYVFKWAKVSTPGTTRISSAEDCHHLPRGGCTRTEELGATPFLNNAVGMSWQEKLKQRQMSRLGWENKKYLLRYTHCTVLKRPEPWQSSLCRAGPPNIHHTANVSPAKQRAQLLPQGLHSSVFLSIKQNGNCREYTYSQKQFISGALLMVLLSALHVIYIPWGFYRPVHCSFGVYTFC